MKRLYAVLTILVLGSLFFAACNDTIALGTRINLKGPIVTILTPQPNREVDPPETDPKVGVFFTLSGTAESDTRVKRMTVTLDYHDTLVNDTVRMGREWQWENSWQTRESDTGAWRAYEGPDINPEDEDPDNPLAPPSWTLDRDDVSWSLPISMDRMETGDYFIEVKAWDVTDRHGSESAKKLKVKFVNTAPTVKIKTPTLLPSVGSDLAAPSPPDYSLLVFDPFNLPEQTWQSLGKFTNAIGDLRYEIEGEAAAAELNFEITNQHDLDNYGAEKKVYYQWPLGGGVRANPPAKGIFTDDGNVGDLMPDGYTKAGARINFSDEVKDGLQDDVITPMQLVTRVKAIVPLSEYKSKGWILYLPDSDKPFADIKFGYKVHKDETPPPDAAELASMTRGNTETNNWAYDDDGLKRLDWTLYRLDGNNETFTGGYQFDGSTKEAWSFKADKSYGVGSFKIVVVVTDVNDKQGDAYHAYFKITSNSTPTVIAWPSDDPLLTKTLWGDSSGNFTISGRAQIEDKDNCDGIHHDVKVDEILIAWIKPEQGLDNDTRYDFKDNPDWDKATPGGFTDGYGNKVWKITNIHFLEDTAGNEGDNAQEEWAFSITLNLFNDLGIGKGEGKIPFTDQAFRIRVLSGVDDQGKPLDNALSSVKELPTKGDFEGPTVKVTHVIVQDIVQATLGQFTTYDLESGRMINGIATGDKVKLRGTWSDESIGRWTTVPNAQNRHINYLNNLVVSWEGASETNNFSYGAVPLTLDNVLDADGGGWETEWRTFADSNTDSLITLTAALTDLGGQVGTGTHFATIETSSPTLTRISSTNADGSYSEDKDTVKGEVDSRYIEIFLEFNTPVTFCTTAQELALNYNTAPRLKLNNSGEAFYFSGNGSNRFWFHYFIDGSSPYNTSAPGQGGGNTPVVPVTNPEGRLNVTEVVFGLYPKEDWKSTAGGTVTFPDTPRGSGNLSVCNPENIASLVGQKRIIIDKTPPTIATNGITFNASAGNYGLGSEIRIYVEFTEDIQVTAPNGSTLVLNLANGTLGQQAATAAYENASGNRMTFVYKVLAGHDTSGYTPNILRVASLALSSTASIKDPAGNSLSLNPSIPAHTSGIIVDTNPPNRPSITGVTSYGSYYNKDYTNFRITGLESGARVQYRVDYTTGDENSDDGWNDYSGTISSGQTGDIRLENSGIYNIAARQYDTAATTQNRSQISLVAGPVRVDTQGGLLERITSSNPDGLYSANSDKNTINIDLEFRIPVSLVGSLPANTTTTYIALNTGEDTTHRARLTSAPISPAVGKKWTFTYQIPADASTPVGQYLDVTAISLDALTILDQPWVDGHDGTQVNVNNWISLNNATYGISSSNKLNAQKKITVMSGRPQVANRPTGLLNPQNTNNTDIRFNGTQLSLTFNRDIDRGNTANKLIIRQINATNSLYQIPAVLSEQEFSDLFINRDAIFTEQTDILGTIWGTGTAASVKAENWQKLGNALYQKGSNGANSSLVSDTAVKYVLKFDVDPAAANNSTAGITGLVAGITITNMGQLRDLFRAAEALSFGVYDREVRISGAALTIDLDPDSTTGGRPLPVKGAYYQWIFPNGFVKDSLGTANGTGAGADATPTPTGEDSNLTSGDTTTGARVLFYSNAGVEKPVIRIDKGSDIEKFYNNDTSENRKAQQPLTSEIKINSRTPGVTIRYWTRQTTDNASQLIMRTNPTDTGRQLPNRNNFTAATHGTTDIAVRKAYFDNTRMRPQSGQTTNVGFDPPAGYGIDAATWRSSGLNTWTPMSNSWGNENTYTTTPPVTIGSVNYSDGGMIIHIQARATLAGITPSTNSDYSYEAAYRSVFVYINQGVNGNGVNNGQNANGHTYGANLDAGALDRVWIRGSDNVYVNPTTPDFPISRDTTKWRKIRQLTPIDATGLAANTTLTETNIRTGAVGSGQYLWFWVTWKINVPAFLNVYYGELPADAADPYQTPRRTREITLGSLGSLEHFPVIPGRTTAVETRNDVYNVRWYDLPSGNLLQNPEITMPARTD